MTTVNESKRKFIEVDIQLKERKRGKAIRLATHLEIQTELGLGFSISGEGTYRIIYIFFGREGDA